MKTTTDAEPPSIQNVTAHGPLLGAQTRALQPFDQNRLLVMFTIDFIARLGLCPLPFFFLNSSPSPPTSGHPVPQTKRLGPPSAASCPAGECFGASSGAFHSPRLR